MSVEDQPNRDGDEEDEEVDEIQYKHAKDAVLFAIDVSPSMLEVHGSATDKEGEKNSAVSAALKCANSLMQQRIISNPNDMMGILLYGTERTRFSDTPDEPYNYSHCYVLTQMGIPAAEDVKRLRRLTEDDSAFDELMVPSKERATLANVLFCATEIFRTHAANFVSRRLFIVTDNDNPHTDKEQREGAFVRARDLYDLGVLIELFPIAKPGQDFDRSKFFDHIQYHATPSDPNAPTSLLQPTRVSRSGGGLTLLSSLLSSIDSHSVPKRALFSNLPFELAPDLRISVKGYILFKRQEIHKSSWVYVHEEKAMLARIKSSRLQADDGQPVPQATVLKAYKFGGGVITFTPEEIAAVRNFGEPVLKLLGFKRITAQSLPAWARTNRSTFLYPSEEDYIGSTRVFSALHASLLASRKMGVAWHVARKNAAPVLVALLAGAERRSEAGDQEMPAGLWMVPLPFADDIRAVPAYPRAAPSDLLIDKMRAVVQQLQLPRGRFVPARYPNPALQWHYRVLQAMALEDDLPDRPEDKTVPRYRQIHKRAGPYVLDWGRQLEADHCEWEQREGRGNAHGALSKRPAPVKSEDDAGAAPAKKARTDADGLAEDHVRSAWKADRIAKFTVAELKAFAAARGITASGGRKADLVEAIEAWCERQ